MNPFDGISIAPGRFYLPKAGVDMGVWPMVACDQYTAQPDKWEAADKAVGSAPSALRLMIPECYLEESDQRVPAIQRAMADYVNRGVLREQVAGMILVERTTQSGKRLGLVLTADLEDYDFSPGSTSPVRPTEGTIVSRIPPRQQVRRGAMLELSHVLLLCNDAKRTVIEPLYAKREELPLLYDTDLLLGGGHIRGWAVEGKNDLAAVAGAVHALKERLLPGGILFAVGDGNHSLATAKAHWQEVKAHLSPAEQQEHPARFAMVELNNLYDDALVFEPIHRVVFQKTGEEVLSMLSGAGLTPVDRGGDVTLVTREGETSFHITRPLYSLPVGTVQRLLDEADAKVDYVHGADAVRAIVQREQAVGILVPPMPKEMLFPAVEANGPLPRKTFSMGEANEKRYYVEARRIVKG